MTNQIVTGSLSQVAQANNQLLAETFLSCDVLLIADMSSSMGATDAPGGKSRYDVAEQDIIRLQGKYQGKVALICFSNSVEFCSTGKPIRLGGGTDLVAALTYIKVADDCGIKLIIISDGEPNDSDKCLQIAKTFTSHIDCVFVGPESDLYGGKAFLEKLANITGGSFQQSDAPGLLAESVEVLMLR